MIGNIDEARKRQFRAALGLAGLTADKWAAERGITGGHLSRVLSGKYSSARKEPSPVADRILAQVDEFSQKTLTEYARQLVAAA